MNDHDTKAWDAAVHERLEAAIAVPRPAEMDPPATRRRSLPYTIPVDADELIAMVRQNGDGR